MVSVCVADEQGIRALSKKLQSLLSDEDSQLYRDNVAKFGVTAEYVREAFSEGTLLQVAASGKSAFYLVLGDDEEIVGFAQTIQRDTETLELDRIVIFPEHTRKGYGTMALKKVIEDAEQKQVKAIIVNAGKDEVQARQFYEKNNFKLIKEETVSPPWGGKITLVTYKYQLR
ncbi:GNAT family N-acetyltransferase [Candidatus Bathyarchaeota archaeon]|nr:GNAT family N-acetyltransferase [Candidatus Bathyarchaeota archaeon]